MPTRNAQIAAAGQASDGLHRECTELIDWLKNVFRYTPLTGELRDTQSVGANWPFNRRTAQRGERPPLSLPVNVSRADAGIIPAQLLARVVGYRRNFCITVTARK
jgi:hypothetical protein